MAIFKSKNFLTLKVSFKLKTTKILRQRWDLRLLVGSFVFRSYPARAGKKNEQKPFGF